MKTHGPAESVARRAYGAAWLLIAALLIACTFCDRASSADAAANVTPPGNTFWAYQPLRNVTLPHVDGATGARHPIDCFIDARLEPVGLQRQPTASRGVLVRRLYFDLWGLPPEVADLEAAHSDAAPDWYERLVDRLLASPRFGERWGRHWLDVVRYGESLTLRGFVLPEAWRYRDYVIQSFNVDRPFDELVREQLAGDLLPGGSLAERRRRRVATTFLTLGNTNLEEQDKQQLDMDVVDEQLDVIGKALLGQTISCARCHDHKFDPIPTRDYYALAGILRGTKLLEHANVSKWTELPLPLPPEEERVFAEAEAKIAALTAEIKDVKQRLSSLTTPVSFAGIVVDDRGAKKVGGWHDSQHTKPYIGDGYLHDQDDGKGEKTVTFVLQLPRNGRYEVRLAYTAGENRADDVPVTVFSADGEKTLRVDMRQPPPIDGHFISLGEFNCEADGQTFVIVSNEGTHGHVVVDAAQFLLLDKENDKPAATGTTVIPKDTRAREQIQNENKRLAQLERELKQQRAAAPARAMVMTVVEREGVADLPIHIRGSVHTLGDVVPRGFLQVVPPAPPAVIPPGQSGRRELAAWITSRDNPLTSRVFANRAWHWLLGQGLVRTVDNFGTTGEVTSHPELLDRLAREFIESGWSVKSLVRFIVLSETYRQDSVAAESVCAADPENRLLARANRKRLEAECLRDALLTLSGQLRLEMGGSTIPSDRTADYGFVATDTRRSVYLPVFRNALPEIFQVFDFPDSSTTNGRRGTSTVATQALYLLNHPAVRDQTLAAARRLLAEDATDDGQRMSAAFLRTVGRAPTPAERAVAQQALAGGSDSPESREQAWANVFHLLVSSIDFRYCD